MTDTVPAALLFAVRDKQRHERQPLASPTERLTVNGLRRRKKSEEKKSLLRVRARTSRSLVLPFDSCASSLSLWVARETRLVRGYPSGVAGLGGREEEEEEGGFAEGPLR